KKITCLFLSASHAHHLYELALSVDLVLLDSLVKCLERHYNKTVSDLLCHVVPLHRHPDLVGACADLVNSEWQRSRAARIHSLEKSCDGFPVCLVLVSRADQLLGHARLSLVVGQPRSLFVETVVVSREPRGKGYGRRMMEATERYARSRGFWRLCLTTHDKQHFYAHLGFVLSEPVQNAGSMTTFMPMEVLQRFSRPPATSGEGDESGLNQTSSPPPQSPPLAPIAPFLNPPLSPQATPLAPFQLMPTLLAPPPPSPANHLPPPPPRPPPPSGLKTLGSKDPPGQTLLETLYRDLKGQPIYWMKKEL
ncbi:N-alpha-acetyltransferase 80, partial [Acipenser ruthenus]|uniref:N-alpha-acetyltransferase 80 n=1 Tax=Acipenser ruthenus TaxID=7906 RepID=UPI0027407E66